MISSITELNRYALPTQASPGQGTSFDAHAPEGYQGSTEGLAAGQRVQTGAQARTASEHLPDRRPPDARHRDGPPTEVELEGTARFERDAHGGYPPDAQALAAGRFGAGQTGAKPSARPTQHPETPGGEDADAATDREVSQLQQRDTEVRTHEQAHIAASGGHAGPASYEYERGPDGRQYAVGGEVSIDASPVPGDPQATIEKMQVVRRAALAPAAPSPQDRRVAAKASRAEADARRELAEAEREERKAEAEAEAGPGVRLPGSDEDGKPLSAAEVGFSSENPIADDFTAADVGRLQEEAIESESPMSVRPGKFAASAVSRARSELAFASQPPGPPDPAAPEA